MFAPLSPETVQAYQADRLRLAEQSRVASQFKTHRVRRTMATVISRFSHPRHEHQPAPTSSRQSPRGRTSTGHSSTTAQSTTLV